jgi:endonuclease/exonuclease/phosphatase family metal-dependent hydrolase
VALAAAVAQQPGPVGAVFLNEACESHAVDVARRLGLDWHAHFVRAWDGHSDCFPAPGAAEGRFGNAVLVRGPAVPFVIPSCDDTGADLARCLPNWSPPAEQRRAICAVGTDAVAMCSVHLDPKRWTPHVPQLVALGRIAGELAAEHGAVVVGGDLNDGPDAVSAVLVDGFADATTLTHPSRQPRRAIDHVLLSGSPAWDATSLDLGWCAATHREDGRCSDHRALAVTVTLG